MDVSPFLRIPITDITASLANMQIYEKCGSFEMNYIDCMEAYGGERGKTKCKELLDDLRECFTRDKRMKRIYAMRDERQRQYEAGERTKEELYAKSPRHDAY